MPLLRPVRSSPRRLPGLRERYLRPVGAGTQKVEEEFLKLFPQVPLIRLDSDTTTGKDAHERLLNCFRSGQARVMIGTQMIAKGPDSQVTLVGVVLADLTLNLPDYRAQERTCAAHAGCRAGWQGVYAGRGHHPDLQARA